MSNEYEVKLTEANVDASEFVINSVMPGNQIGFVYLVWNSIRKHVSGVFFAVVETTNKKEITKKMTNKKLNLSYPPDKSCLIFESGGSHYKMSWSRVYSIETCSIENKTIDRAREIIMNNSNSLLVMSRDDDGFCFVSNHEELVSAIKKYNQHMNQSDVIIDHESVEVNLRN
jgi:hypothetical protein